jgi:hypothetical protein
VNRTLVAALLSFADAPFRAKVRSFLNGLSLDELGFIAEFLGSCILESGQRSQCSRAQLARRIAEFQQARLGGVPLNSPDQEHKMILLLEFLCRSSLQQFTLPLDARPATR